MSFSALSGITVDYVVGTPPSVSLLVDYSVPVSVSVPVQVDYAVARIPQTTVQTDYSVTDNVSALRAGTPVRTLILVVVRYDVSTMPMGVNIGDGQANPMALGFSLNSTSYNTAAPLGLIVSSTETHEVAALSTVIGTQADTTVTAMATNIGTAAANTVPTSMTIERVSRGLDIEVSLVTTELQSVEDEP